MVLSQGEENALHNHKLTFKLANKNFVVSAFMMANLNVDEERWKYAYAAYRWFL